MFSLIPVREKVGELHRPVDLVCVVHEDVLPVEGHPDHGQAAGLGHAPRSDKKERTKTFNNKSLLCLESMFVYLAMVMRSPQGFI